MICSFDSCTRKHYAKGYCHMHYRRLWRNGDVNAFNLRSRNGVCEVVGCTRPIQSSGMCNMHRQRYHRLGYTGKAEPLYNPDGLGSITNDGYLIKQEDYVIQLEHRRIAEKALGKPLPKGSVVHHLNGDKLDNRPFNLVVCPDESYHKFLHRQQKLIGWQGPEHTEEFKMKRAGLAALTLHELFSRND